MIGGIALTPMGGHPITPYITCLLDRETTSMPKSIRARVAKKEWAKPYDGFPLSYHPPSGRLYKVIRQRRHYFGYAADWQSALEKYQRERDDLHSGRTPRAVTNGLTVRDLVNHFLTAKRHQLDTAEITARTFADYHSTCGRIVGVFGKQRLVDDLAADDFQKLRESIAKTNGPVSLGNEVQRVRVVFKYAYDASLIDKPIRYGPTFKRPSSKVLWKARQEKGQRMFEAADIRRMVENAGIQLRAMILLGINCGFGNHDVGTLPKIALDLDGGWVDFPRPKTAVDRRCPLWPETVAALREAIAQRPTPKDEANNGMVFLTKYGHQWSTDSKSNPISAECRKLLKSLDLYRPGLGFYALRHTFETVGGGAKDQVATSAIMGHADRSVGAVYRERIEDDRLRAVVNHVRQWLFELDDPVGDQQEPQGNATTQSGLKVYRQA